MVKELFPNWYPVSQLANIGGADIRKNIFRRIILIHLFYPCPPPTNGVYTQKPPRFPQNWIYFPNSNRVMHRSGSKINDQECLVIFPDHQYGLSPDFYQVNYRSIAPKHCPNKGFHQPPVWANPLKRPILGGFHPISWLFFFNNVAQCSGDKGFTSFWRQIECVMETQWRGVNPYHSKSRRCMFQRIPA